MAVVDKLIPHKDNGQLSTGEAYTIWTQVTTRYDSLEIAQHMLNLVHDEDFKAVVNTGISNIIEPQIKKLEDLASKNKIPLPARPPKTVDIKSITDTIRDEGIFRTILDAAQAALLVHVKAINICNNDSLRNTFKDFLIQDLDNYDFMVKYGKAKGWVHNPPNYKTELQ